MDKDGIDKTNSDEVESKASLLTPFNQCTKRRKLSNKTSSKKKATKIQKNNLLSFLTPKPKKEGANFVGNDVEVVDLITPTIPNQTEEKKSESGKANQSISRSRYGRKRNKVSYCLEAMWGLEEPTEAKEASQDDEDYEVEDEVTEDDEDYNLEKDSNQKNKKTKSKKKTKNNNKNRKKKSPQQKKSRSLSLETAEDKGLTSIFWSVCYFKKNIKYTETFFMTKAEKAIYLKKKMMDAFNEDLAKRRALDQRLYGGKTAHSFFQQVANKRKDTKPQKTETQTDVISHLDLPLFPSISSIQPHPTTQQSEKEEIFEIQCQDLMEDEFDNEMDKIEEKLSFFLFSPAPKAKNKKIEFTSKQKLNFSEGNVCESYQSTATTPRYTHYWTSEQSLAKYCASSTFSEIVNQTNRQFPDIKHSTIRDELLMCLHRTIDLNLSTHNLVSDDQTNTDLHTMWCDKYRPFKTTQVVGNWMQADDLKKWLKAWTNTEEKESYLAGSEDNWLDGLDCDDDEDWEPYMNQEIVLSNTVLLTGPTACGKTASVCAVALELNYKLIQVNCGIIKTAKDLNDQIGEATRSQKVKQQSIILLEEVDNMLESAPGIVKAIDSYSKHSRCPIILTATKVPEMLKNLGLTHFKLDYGPLVRLALRTYVIGLCEGVCLTRNEIEKIVKHFNFDLRAVLINLQFWLTSPRTFDHFSIANDKIPLPSNAIRRSNRKHKIKDADNENEDIFPTMLYNLPLIQKRIESMHRLSIFQRIIGFADISFNACNGKDVLFWSHFVDGDVDSLTERDLDDNLYCFVQHILGSDYLKDIIFHSFQYWFIDNVDSIRIRPKRSSSESTSSVAQLFNDGENEEKESTPTATQNANPFTYSWTEKTAVVESKKMIQTMLDNIFGSDDDVDIKMNRKERGVRPRPKPNMNTDIEWLQDWSVMIDTLSDNDILQKPHGCCPNVCELYLSEFMNECCLLSSEYVS